MRILLLTHSFNSLSQRLFIELQKLGHEVSVEFDINDQVTAEAVRLFRPDLILAPFLKRAIAESIWREHLCWIVHPGPAGDRGPSSLDWAIQTGVSTWGVTVLQAEAEMDAGPVWASVEFPMRAACKGHLYRHEVADASVTAVRQALERLESDRYTPQRLALGEDGRPGGWRPLMRQSDRRIEWSRHTTAEVLARLRAADGHPGVRDRLAGLRVRMYNPWPEGELRGEPGAILAIRDGAVCLGTVDGAVWVTHLCRDDASGNGGLKLPAAQVLGDRIADVQEAPLDAFENPDYPTWQEIRYRERNGVGYLYFDCHNGALSVDQCRRLTAICRRVKASPPRVLVLMGGADFWSNGIHLHRIEADDHPAEASWGNINAMNDLTREIVELVECPVVAALRGNAAAGGVFFALAADYVWAVDGVVLNPHYKNMGNLYGSEYWTYLLPRRVRHGDRAVLLEQRLPMGVWEAHQVGVVDEVLSRDGAEADIQARAEALASDPNWSGIVRSKRVQRARDEARKPLARYREEEMTEMQLNFFGFDPSYHVARFNFVHRRPLSRTPIHLARHRDQRLNALTADAS
ncbi:hydrogenase maturation protein [Alkalilimnicola ehrlichii]|uniref:hydrogenase maturation protein n=1 Tax=Alkalilimnicola ehrlichii TaxID=351052 RepID=UPI003BA01040